MELCARQAVVLPLLKFGCMFCMDIMKRKYKPSYKRKKVGTIAFYSCVFQYVPGKMWFA